MGENTLKIMFPDLYERRCVTGESGPSYIVPSGDNGAVIFGWEGDGWEMED